MIQKHELRMMNYTEFGVLLDGLTKKVQAANIHFDLLVPILRSGGITGMHLASKLEIKNILPAQYKYLYEPQPHIVKKFDFPRLYFEVPAASNILVVDTNTVEGKIANHVISDVRADYPAAKIYFATAFMDVACELRDVEKVFFGRYSNEARSLTIAQTQEQNISNDVTIFPWEDLEEQWQEIRTLN